MFCKKCGNNIENGFRFCGFCGAPIETDISAQPIQGTNESFQNDNTVPKPPAQNKKGKPTKSDSKKYVIFLAVITVASLLVITAIVIFLCTDFIANGSSYTTVIDKKLEAIQDIDVKKFMEILPDDYIQYDLDTTDNYSNYDDMLLDYEDKLWQTNRKNKKEYGTDFKIVYEIKEEGHCKDTKELSELTEKFNNAYNGKSKISEAVRAVVSTEIKSSERSGNRTTEIMYFINIDNKWYLDIEGLSETLDY